MPGGQEKQRILILEDGLLLAMEIEEAVRSAGFDVTVAGSLREAWAAIETMTFDAAVLDYFLPDGTSGELALHMAATGPVVFMSGYGRQDFEAALDDVPLFDKPVDMAAMLLWLTDAINRAAESPWRRCGSMIR